MKKQYSKIALVVGIMLAMVFIFGCSDGDDGGSKIAYGPSITYEGKTYKTVIIGGQTWMAENLNYAVEGSRCYNNQESNCEIYGRLYDWATAMDISSSYNSGYYHPSSEHRGICPSGWHLPSSEEWGALITAVGGWETAGTKLKATNGWKAPYDANGNGTDDYGFSALPGSGGGSDDKTAGYFGNWWSTTEYLAPRAHSTFMSHSAEAYNSNENNKMYFFSVRCVQNSSYSSIPSSSSAQSVEIIYGPSVPYEGKTYKTVVIGTQTWMAENLNYAVEGSKCGNGDTLSDANTVTCDTYGRVYDWVTAMALPDNCFSSFCAWKDTTYKGICPSGWHIPSRDEWDTLINFAGGSVIADEKLKTSSGWVGNYNGTDDYGFSALPGDDGITCNFWSATERNFQASSALQAVLKGYNMYGGNSTYSDKKNFSSVRCIQD